VKEILDKVLRLLLERRGRAESNRVVDCPASALIGQNWRFEEGRISGSS
jgi:hypothetical protein